jgi:pimeloyl-ACP methyl ester carboxylesterase
MKTFILHGWTYQTATWDALRTELTSRSVEHEFLLIPGLTDGTNPIWTMEDYVQWLAEKTAGYDKVVLYGHSNGGRISLAYAAKYPEKVARLILEDSAGIPPRGWRKLKRDTFRKCAQLLGRFIRFEKLRGVFRKAIRASDYARATPEMRKTMSNLVAVDLGKILDRIQCPTLIIWGALDKTTPLEDGKLIHKGIRSSRLHIISDARHGPHITHTKEIADLIEAELKQV